MLSFKKNICFLSVLNLFMLFACQSEESEQEFNSQETIANSSPLTSYVQRIAMVKTVQDNVIDQSSYCTIKLPYEVDVNGVKIPINSATDYQKVWDNINAVDTDTDDVKIKFPVTMVYYNYYEKLLNNQSDYQQLLDYWNALPDLLSKINCLSIKYPITINVYNTVNQIGSSVKVVDDKTFFLFINNLNNNQLIAIKYPISIIAYNNSVTTIATNLQFENAIKEAIDNCPENHNNSLVFSDVLGSVSWKISYFYDDYQKSLMYKDFVFLFKDDKSLTATKSGMIYTGHWETKMNNDNQEFKITFDSDELQDLNKNWTLFEFNASQIRFRGVLEEAGKETDYLYLEKVN